MGWHVSESTGGVWTIGPRITDFVYHGIRGMWNGLVVALVLGFVAAAISRFISKRRNASKS